MRKSYPVEFVAELRGIQPASEFTARDTGELVKLAPTLQLECDNDDGSVELHHVRLSDRLVTSLRRGRRLREGCPVGGSLGSSHGTRSEALGSRSSGRPLARIRLSRGCVRAAAGEGTGVAVA